MKKSLKIIIILVAIILLSACGTYQGTMTINKDKSMDITYIYAIEDTYLPNKDEKLLTDKQIDTLEKNGYTVEEYTERGMTGYTLTKHVNNIDKVGSEGEKTYNLNGLLDEYENMIEYFEIDQKPTKNIYKANFVFNLDDIEGLSDYSSFITNDILNKATLTFKVQLPNKPISSNATKSEGKTLEWTLDPTKNNEIQFEFSIDHFYTKYVIITIIALIAILIFNFLRRTFSDQFRSADRSLKKMKKEMLEVRDFAMNDYRNREEDEMEQERKLDLNTIPDEHEEKKEEDSNSFHDIFNGQ